MGADQRANEVLGTLLAELGWSPNQLAGAVNGLLGPSCVATTAGIRKLGNAEGGNEDNLRFVHHHLIWVAKLLRQARFTSSAVANRLLAEWAQLAQLAAWMAMDAGRHGLSQRYVTSGLHAAHTAGDRSVGTYLLSDMSQWRVIQGRLSDGVELGRAARDAVELANAAHEAAKSTPAVVRALAASGFAKAQAAVDNARGFHAAAEEARTLLDSPGALDARPPYLAWFDPGALDTQLAENALILTAVSSRNGRALLDDATEAFERDAIINAEGFEDFTDWWDAIEVEPLFPELVAERERRFGLRPRGEGNNLPQFQQAFRDAGFSEVGTLRQINDRRLFVAIR